MLDRNEWWKIERSECNWCVFNRDAVKSQETRSNEFKHDSSEIENGTCYGMKSTWHLFFCSPHFKYVLLSDKPFNLNMAVELTLTSTLSRRYSFRSEMLLRLTLFNARLCLEPFKSYARTMNDAYWIACDEWIMCYYIILMIILVQTSQGICSL